jgi:hemerythrin-like metal-binding protein
MSELIWSESLELGVERMDSTHREFVELYNALASAPTDCQLGAFDRFIAHTVEHFDQENRWMEKVGFPGCHKAEHDRVLAVMHEVRKRAEEGDAFLAKRLIEELPAWFEHHAGSMDAALAYHLDQVGFDFERECTTRDATATGACGPASLEGNQTPVT